MVRPYLPIATTVVALNAVSSFAAPVRVFEPRDLSNDHYVLAGRNLQPAVDWNGVNDSTKPQPPQRQVLNRRSNKLVKSKWPGKPAPTRGNSVASTASTGSIYSTASTAGHGSPSHEASNHNSATHNAAPPAEAPAKKPSGWRVYKKGAVEELQKNPIRTAFSVVGTGLAIAALATKLSPPKKREVYLD